MRKKTKNIIAGDFIVSRWETVDTEKHLHPSSSLSSPSIPTRPLMHHITVLMRACGSYQVQLKQTSPALGRRSHPEPPHIDFQQRSLPGCLQLRLPQRLHFPLAGDTTEGTALGDIAAHQELAAPAPGVSRRGILQSKALWEASQTEPSKGLSSNQLAFPTPQPGLLRNSSLKCLFGQREMLILCYPSISHPVPSRASAVLGAVQTQMIHSTVVLSDGQILKLPSES